MAKKKTTAAKKTAAKKKASDIHTLDATWEVSTPAPDTATTNALTVVTYIVTVPVPFSEKDACNARPRVSAFGTSGLICVEGRVAGLGGPSRLLIVKAKAFGSAQGGLPNDPATVTDTTGGKVTSDNRFKFHGDNDPNSDLVPVPNPTSSPMTHWLYLWGKVQTDSGIMWLPPHEVKFKYVLFSKTECGHSSP